jgi:hypothetical protein
VVVCKRDHERRVRESKSKRIKLNSEREREGREGGSEEAREGGRVWECVRKAYHPSSRREGKVG